jgi:uncharacterized OB-fold protein
VSEVLDDTTICRIPFLREASGMAVLLPQAEGIPLPRPTLVSAPFWDGCGRGELLFQRCECCDKAVFPPALQCRYCGAAELGWERSEGKGSVYSWSVVSRPQTPAFTIPYVAAIVDLDEGYQILSNIIGCDPADICLGIRLRVEFHEIGENVHLPYFRPDIA